MPTVKWPACDATDTVYACAEAARNIPSPTVARPAADGAVHQSRRWRRQDGPAVDLGTELAKRTSGSVLVVDANFRKPDLTTELHVPLDAASDQATLIYPTNLPRLSFLPAPAAERVRSGSAYEAAAATPARSASQKTAPARDGRRQNRLALAARAATTKLRSVHQRRAAQGLVAGPGRYSLARASRGGADGAAVRRRISGRAFRLHAPTRRGRSRSRDPRATAAGY